MSELNSEERDQLEELLFEAHFSAQKYLESGKGVHRKLMEVSVSDAMNMITELSNKLKDDEYAENYKLHLFVPLHLCKLLEMRDEQE